jgi:hypothetical protein
VSIRTLKLIPILFFTKVQETVRGKPPIRLAKSILLIFSTNKPKVETFPRRPLFLNHYPYNP